jgi:hypothetical protein
MKGWINMRIILKVILSRIAGLDFYGSVFRPVVVLCGEK